MSMYDPCTSLSVGERKSYVNTVSDVTEWLLRSPTTTQGYQHSDGTYRVAQELYYPSDNGFGTGILRHVGVYIGNGVESYSETGSRVTAHDWVVVQDAGTTEPCGADMEPDFYGYIPLITGASVVDRNRLEESTDYDLQCTVMAIIKVLAHTGNSDILLASLYTIV